jgi:hypothetical protein
MAAKASALGRKFVPSAAQAASRGRVTGKPLAGTSDPRLNAALAMLCSLQAGGAVPSGAPATPGGG